MNNPKRQHVVPRVYLEHFRDADGFLSIYSKRRNQKIRQKPENALIRRFYYSQPVNRHVNSDHGIETNLLNGLETDYPKLFKKLTSGNGDADLEVLFKTMFMLRCRSPAFREAFELGLADYADGVFRSIPRSSFPAPPAKHPDIFEKVGASIDPHRSLYAMAFYLKTYCNPIAHSSYRLMKTPNKSQILTSDNPVVWYEKTKVGFGEIYPTSITANTRILVPIDRRNILVGRIRREGEPELRPGIGELGKREVQDFNVLQFACSWDHVVGSATIPKALRERYRRLSPLCEISYFDSKRDRFHLDRIVLKPHRDKLKFRYV